MRERTRPLPREVLRAVADEYEMPVSHLLGGRTSRRAEAAALAMYLLRSLCGASYPEAAEAVQRRNHTTALHACRRVAAGLRSRDDHERIRWAGLVERVSRALHQVPPDEVATVARVADASEAIAAEYRRHAETLRELVRALEEAKGAT